MMCSMEIDTRLNEIDDCLYRVAIRLLVVQDGKVLLVKEAQDGWWALPGGGIDHGDTVSAAALREIEEELGVAPSKVTSDFEIVYYSIGNVVNGIPRMNLYFKASVSPEAIQPTDDVTETRWFTREEFLRQEMHSSYDKNELVRVIFAA